MATYPVITAGQDLTADLLASMLPTYVTKTSATTRTSTTTLADDPDMQIALAANATYWIEMYIYYSTGAAAFFKDFWNLPAGATGIRSSSGISSSATATDVVTTQWTVKNAGTAIVHGGSTTVSDFTLTLSTGVITTTTAGTLTYQWAQSVSTAVTTAVRNGSFMRVTRIA